MTVPTIGQIVFYTPGLNEPIQMQDAGGLPAMVVYGKNGGPFNLAVFDSEGNSHARINVMMLDATPPAKKDAKEGEEPPPWPPANGPYCMAERKDVTVPEPVPPELLSINPTKTTVGAAEFELECAGKGFTPASKIEMGGVEVITKYYNSEMVTTIVKPESAAPGNTEVMVCNGELDSEVQTLVFEEPPPPEPPPEVETEKEASIEKTLPPNVTVKTGVVIDPKEAQPSKGGMSAAPKSKR